MGSLSSRCMWYPLFFQPADYAQNSQPIYEECPQLRHLAYKERPLLHVQCYQTDHLPGSIVNDVGNSALPEVPEVGGLCIPLHDESLGGVGVSQRDCCSLCGFMSSPWFNFNGNGWQMPRNLSYIDSCDWFLGTFHTVFNHFRHERGDYLYMILQLVSDIEFTRYRCGCVPRSNGASERTHFVELSNGEPQNTLDRNVWITNVIYYVSDETTLSMVAANNNVRVRR